MFIRTLETTDPSIQLVRPDIVRDSVLGVSWLAGDEGRRTLKRMGITDEDNKPSSLDEERSRVSGFLTGTDQYNWMIKAGDEVVGSIWVGLKPTKYIQAPALSIMIGDSSYRGEGIGYIASAAVVRFLASEGTSSVHARHLENNRASKAMLKKLGFKPDGEPYEDADHLHWQNVVVAGN